MSPWSTPTVIAVGISAAVLVIIIIAFTIFMRKRRLYLFRKRTERASVAELTWSPVTTLNSTPFASVNNSPVLRPQWDKPFLRNSSQSNLSSRVPSSFYSETTIPSSPLAMRSKSALNLVLGPPASDLEEEAYDGDVSCRVGDDDEEEKYDEDEEEEEDAEEKEKRSISPLVMSPILARLPSVKSGSTSRVGELIRSSGIDSSQDFSSHDSCRDIFMSALTYQSGVLETTMPRPPKIEAPMSVVERRSALFSQAEMVKLFQGRNSGRAPGARQLSPGISNISAVPTVLAVPSA
ncbi:hypothetical protein DFP72DRAFT_1080073 [Ephemerocybe angulata]|uniref:Uncharacterized protein n=1 Tax=Ephemerocybe angulata TaxID=980116 RepID=A0A8H6HAJ2_9AGAR|nr:hypothetical protein DFP72DRAFT_1080073 [Tulosesus angulatus]